MNVHPTPEGGLRMRLLGFLTDEHWHANLPMGVGVPAATGVFAWLAQVEWGPLLAGASMAASTLGGLFISLYRQWRLTQIEVMERERRLREMPADRLDPEATRAAERHQPPTTPADKPETT